ncbi:MAG: hypothetical protein IT371_25120 [Deltaproteobacteria bacterium]|nr:hypothetical protein [Deltaproteobacteria bacterium]
MRHSRLLSPLLAAALWSAGCADPAIGPSDAGVGEGFVDGAATCTDPNGDADSDGVANGEEGCLQARDSDRDGIADWQDFDSDGDGVGDVVEKGLQDAADKTKCKGAKGAKKGWPCDTDSDGVPDYLDVDSDGDGVLDKDEDANGDGLLGCCITSCNKPVGGQLKGCVLTKDGCGPGQTCEKGKCTPAVGFACSNGETNALMKDTFGDGKLDNERGNFICRDATESSTKGRRPVKNERNKDGDWHIAFEKTAKFGLIKITEAGPKDSAAVVNEESPQGEVAGFVITRDTTKDKVQDEMKEILSSIASKTPGGKGAVSVRSTGVERRTHDRFQSVEGAIVDIKLTSASNVSTVRNEVIGSLLGKPMANLSNLPTPFGSSHSDFVMRLIAVRRFAFKRDETKKLVLDEKGMPIDDGDKAKWRLVVMGAIAGRDNYQDPARPTGFIVDDLSNGTGVATYTDAIDDECDVATITSLPVADVIWVIDESGSMSDNRDDITNNANNFFSRALASGLDFRMGVTNVCSPTGSYKSAVGKFCSESSTDSNHMGGEDRFLLPTEQTTFGSCIKNPPGYEGGSEYGLTNAMEAVKKHLPRASNDPTKVRPEAKLVVIIATDEVPEEFSSSLSSYYKTCNLGASAQDKLNTGMKQYLDYLSGITEPEAAAIVHVIGGACNNSCGADVAHGYKDLQQSTGGVFGDVCQKDLGNTLQQIVDNIVGAASPVVLEYVPISASLAVALDGVQLPRSRTNGFDYRASANSLAFLSVKFEKGSEVIASYKRWKKQISPDSISLP